MLPRRLFPILCASCLLATSLARADNPTLDAAVLKKVKAATIHLEVQLPNGTTVEGSGFCTDQPGLVLTNAHVLGMLDADSRPPVKIAATLNSGEANARTLPAKWVASDRDSDLALVRIAGNNLPAALSVVPAKELTETAEVYIFGFPLGKRLGKNITVSKSSVSSLRTANGQLKQVQVNGGMHPGNSGGPVTNAKGQVVGVAVSGIEGTSINFAVPGEVVRGFLNGKIVTMSADLGYKDADKIKMPFRLVVVDPLGRLKDIVVDTWTGPAGKRNRPGGTTQPAPETGDSSRTAVKVPYTKQSLTRFELALPPEKDSKQVYWIQPHYTNGAGETIWFGAWAPRLGTPVERKPVKLAYKPPLNQTGQTRFTSEGTFRLRAEGEEHSLTMKAQNTLVERTGSPSTGGNLPVQVTYQGFGINLLEDNKPIKTDADFKRLLSNMRFLSADVESQGESLQSSAERPAIHRGAERSDASGPRVDRRATARRDATPLANLEGSAHDRAG
jgi:hypothetical protein